MGNMIIDLQLACENTEGLPSEAQILQWAIMQGLGFADPYLSEK